MLNAGHRMVLSVKNFNKFAAGVLFLTGGISGQAQFGPSGGLPSGVQHALLDVLGGGPSFYGRAAVQLSTGTNQPPTSLSCNIAVLSGALRTEVDDAAQVKQTHSISVLRPDRNRAYLVLPDVKSYVEIAYGNSSLTDAVAPPRITKTPAGSEMVGDVACAKSQWEVVEADGAHFDVTTWTATNSSNFPIQVKVGAPAALVQFEDLHMEAPAGELFEPPSGYTKYEGIQSLIQRDVQKAQNPNASTQ